MKQCFLNFGQQTSISKRTETYEVSHPLVPKECSQAAVYEGGTQTDFDSFPN